MFFKIMRAFLVVLIGIVAFFAGIVIGFGTHQPVISPWFNGSMATFLIIWGAIVFGVGCVDLDRPSFPENCGVYWPNVIVFTFFVAIAAAGLVTLWFLVKAAVLWLIGLF